MIFWNWFKLSRALSLVTLCFLISAPLAAQPNLPRYAPPLIGRVVDARTNKGAAKAVVMIYQRGEVLAQTRTDAEGDFKITNLPKTPTSLYVVMARYLQKESGAAPVIGIIALTDKMPLEIKLPVAQPLRLKITNTAGAPLENTLVTIPKIQFNDEGGRATTTVPWTYEGLPISGFNVTAADGSVTIPDLPLGATAYIEVHKKTFADTVAKIPIPANVPANAEIPLKLARETIVEGTVMLNETEPLAVPQWRLKMQGWHAPWAEGEYFRMSNLDNKGHYEIHNVTSLDVLAEETHGINIDMWGNENPLPGVSGAYVPPRAGWDLMVTIARDGHDERYISFVQALDKGLKYKEGERVHYDFSLVPMALVKGKLALPVSPQLMVSYRDPRSIYSPWQVKVAADGTFEIPVPVGELNLTIGNRRLKISDLKAQETRTLTTAEISAAPEIPTAKNRIILQR